MRKEIIRKIKQYCGIYEPDYVYQIPIAKIKIQNSFRLSRIGNVKWRKKWAYYNRNHEFESMIILTPDFTLVDGYSSFRIAEILKHKTVPVMFCDSLMCQNK